jgi:predicted transcriptional regulator
MNPRKSIIRQARKGNFTTMQNELIRNKDLTMQAKFLLMLMFSYPDNWEFNLEHLSRQSKNGITAARSALNELIAAGYVTRARHRLEDGTYGQVEYTVRDTV